VTYDSRHPAVWNGVEGGGRRRPAPRDSKPRPLPCAIGGNVPYGEFFLGRIDEMRLYNRALSLAEIQADMATPVGGAIPVTQAPAITSALASPARWENLPTPSPRPIRP